MKTRFWSLFTVITAQCYLNFLEYSVFTCLSVNDLLSVAMKCSSQNAVPGPGSGSGCLFFQLFLLLMLLFVLIVVVSSCTVIFKCSASVLHLWCNIRKLRKGYLSLFSKLKEFPTEIGVFVGNIL